jgi:hypothetical protein
LLAAPLIPPRSASPGQPAACSRSSPAQAPVLVCHPFQALQSLGKLGGLICLHVAVDQFADLGGVRRRYLAGSHGGKHSRSDGRGILGSIDRWQRETHRSILARRQDPIEAKSQRWNVAGQGKVDRFLRQLPRCFSSVLSGLTASVPVRWQPSPTLKWHGGLFRRHGLFRSRRHRRLSVSSVIIALVGLGCADRDAVGLKPSKDRSADVLGWSLKPCGCGSVDGARQLSRTEHREARIVFGSHGHSR